MKYSVGIILFLLTSLVASRAAHLVGGEITYECLGNNNYRLKLVVYRDCASQGASFDSPATVTIYNGNSIFANLALNYSSRTNLPITAPNNCVSLPPFVCTEKAIYIDTVQMPPSAQGYTISYQRCCRNASISNLVAPGSYGNTFTINIPPNDINCNSSPDFTSDPPVALCLNVSSTVDMSTTETDGDSVVYSLCRMLNGGGQSTGGTPGGPNTPAPNPASPPPYAFVPFANGFSAANPIISAPAFSIDPQTGILSGTPTQVGQYVFAICASEYRNGVLLSTVRRDFQFNVTSACRTPKAVISGQAIDSSTLCTGRTVTFTQNSQYASSYLWDFGDSTVTNDTSNQANPTYTYRDTGLYRVRLIANPRQSCADTSYSLYRIFNPISANFSFTAEDCFDTHSLDFTTTGRYSDSATFYWSFGGQTNQGDSSRLEEPTGIRYTQPGIYVVSLFIDDSKCFANYQDTVRLYPRLEIGQIISETENCAPLEVSFTDDSKFTGTALHYWDFGDGSFSNDRSTIHTYREPGTYSVTHRVITTENCIDSAQVVFTDLITVHPVPKARLFVNPTETDIYNPKVSIRDSSQGSTYSETFLPNGQVLENLESEAYTFTDTGTFTIEHIVYNQYGCPDTAIIPVRIAQPVNFFIPSAFTPNQDGINDKFSFVVTGVSRLDFKIFNRWGELVFSGTNSQVKWDGTDQKTGNPLPSGVYTYICVGRVSSTGKDEKKTGTIKLLR